MTMNYCGRCGSANGTTARFCRQCGAELGSQAAVSSSSPPLNVEFSTKSVMKNPGRENKPAPPETKPSPANKVTKDDPGNRAAAQQLEQPAGQPPGASKNSEGGDQDPKAISESLRRIRTSGPLIIEAIKQNTDRQNSERVNEIIAQSVQGMNENKAELKKEERPAPPPPPPAPPLVQRGKKRDKMANRGQLAQPLRPTSAGSASGGLANTGSSNTGLANTAPASAKPANARQNNQMGIQAAAQSIAQTGAQKVAQTAAAVVAATQSVTRKTTGFLSVSAANRSNPHANGGHNAPSTVLVQASGFKPQSGFGPKVLIGMIALAVVLAAGIYFPFRDKLLTPAQSADGDRNLVSPEDESAQLVKLGERERAQGKFDAAMQHFNNALELAPNNPAVRFLLAQTYLLAGQTDDALRGYQEILRIAPEHLDARLQLAEIYRARGNWNTAYKEYQNIIQLDHSSPQAAAALEAIEKQQATEPSDEPLVKNALFRRNAQPRPNAPALPGATVRTPVPLLSQRTPAAPGISPPAALSGARPEEKPDPRAVSDTHKKLGVRYLNIREFQAAINEFLRALSLTPDDKDLYYFIGSSYHGLGQLAEAHNYYRRVDSGPYVGPAQSGTKQTEKAAREAFKRRETQRFQSINNGPENEPEGAKTNKSLMNRIMNSFKE